LHKNIKIINYHKNKGNMNLTHKTICIFIFFLSILSCNALHSIEINISKTQANLLSQRVFINETDLRHSKLLQWNKKENFLSLGIAHFIWYPQGQKKHFVESFPLFLTYLKKTGYDLPDWLSDSTACFWQSEEDFYCEPNSEEKKRLYKFLQDCKQEQTAFLVARLQQAIPNILAASSQKEKVQTNIKELAKSMNGVYAMLDYVNFKGEGLDPKESYDGRYWGLLQVLENMQEEAQSPAHAFADAAKFVLTRRIKLAPQEKSWLAGWNKRLETYYE